MYNSKKSFIALILISATSVSQVNNIYSNDSQTIVVNFPIDDHNGLFLPANEIHQMASTAAQRLGYTYQIGDACRPYTRVYPLPDNDATLHAVIISSPLCIDDVTQKNYPPEKLITYLWEPPAVYAEHLKQAVHAMSGIVFTWDDDLVDNKKFFKLTYAQLPNYICEPLPFHEKKFCCVMAGNYHSSYSHELYSARRTTIRCFEQYAPGQLDIYGNNWDIAHYPAYKGYTPNKLATLRNYKFCICYENSTNIRGYISEKIQHCLFVGCVPIYWGATNITDYIPENCFIDRRKFNSDRELYDFLTHITADEYQRYIDNIHRYLHSTQAKLFSTIYFVDTMLKAIIPDYNRSQAFSAEQAAELEEIDAIYQKINPRITVPHDR